jgi:hypothetical protein
MNIWISINKDAMGEGAVARMEYEKCMQCFSLKT